MKRYTIKQYIFMALCCDLGLFCKRIISPFTNVITDALHIPGGIGTSFSIMFLIVAAMICNKFGSATLMSLIQSGIALSLGMVGSMGLLSPIGYVVPGVIIDLVLLIFTKINIPKIFMLLLANSLAAVSASLTANIIVFHLAGPPLYLYVMVAITSGTICGVLANDIVCRVLPAINVISQTNY